MKKYFFNKVGIALSLMVVMLSSCLKDDSVELDPNKGFNVVEFGNVSQINVIGSVYPLYVKLLELQPSALLEVPISWSGPESATSQDINVKLSLADPSVITEYNDEQHTTYEMLPSSLYSIGSLDVTIKSGTRKGYLPITLKVDQFDFTKSYVIPLKIVSASQGTVSGNFGTILINVGPKNKWDGHYSYKTSAATALLPNRSTTTNLVTVGPNSVKLDPGLLSYYSNEVKYTIDPATNKVTVAMTSLLPIATDPVSAYDPATKTFKLRWTSNGGARLFEETIVFLGPR